MRRIGAACGNDCAACPRYVIHPYEKTAEELRHTAELWMRIGYRDHAVSNDEISCAGCKEDNWCRYQIVSCCAEKRVGSCAECPAYPCERILECFEVTSSFDEKCRLACSEEEYNQMRRAFFEKRANLDERARTRMPNSRRHMSQAGKPADSLEGSVRERIEACARERFGVEAEQLPFNHEDYAVLRHQNSGKWFAVFFVKPREVLGLEGDGDVEVMSVKVPDRGLANMLLQQPGYLTGYPAASWHWVSAVLDGTVPTEDLLSWLEDSYRATAQGANKRTPLPKRGA